MTTSEDMARGELDDLALALEQHGLSLQSLVFILQREWVHYDPLSTIVEVCMFTRWVNIKTKTVCKSVLVRNRSGKPSSLVLIRVACTKHSRCKARFHQEVSQDLGPRHPSD